MFPYHISTGASSAEKWPVHPVDQMTSPETGIDPNRVVNAVLVWARKSKK